MSSIENANCARFDFSEERCLCGLKEWFRPRGLPQKQTAAGKLKRQRGTLRPARELGVIEIATSRDPPLMPGWLTEAGKSACHDNVGRVMQTGLGTEIDSDLLGFTVD